MNFEILKSLGQGHNIGVLNGDDRDSKRGLKVGIGLIDIKTPISAKTKSFHTDLSGKNLHLVFRTGDDSFDDGAAEVASTSSDCDNDHCDGKRLIRKGSNAAVRILWD